LQFQIFLINNFKDNFAIGYNNLLSVEFQATNMYIFSSSLNSLFN